MAPGSPADQNSADNRACSITSKVTVDGTSKDLHHDQSHDHIVEYRGGRQHDPVEQETPRASSFKSPEASSGALAAGVDPVKALHAQKALSPLLRIDNRLLRHLDTVGLMSKEEYEYWRHITLTDMEDDFRNDRQKSDPEICCGNPRCFTALMALEAQVEGRLAEIRKKIKENPERDARGHYPEIDEAVKRLPKAERLIIYGKIYEGSLETSYQTIQDEVMQYKPKFPAEHARSQSAIQSNPSATGSEQSRSENKEGLRRRRDAPPGMTVHVGSGPSQSRSPQATPQTALFDRRPVQQFGFVFQDVASEERYMADNDGQDPRMEGRAEGRLKKHKASDYDALASPSKRTLRSPRLPVRTREHLRAPAPVPLHMVSIDLRVPSGWEFCLADYRFSGWRHLSGPVTHNPPRNERNEIGIYKQRFTVSIPLDWEMYCKRGEDGAADYPLYCNEAANTALSALPFPVAGYTIQTLPK